MIILLFSVWFKLAAIGSPYSDNHAVYIAVLEINQTADASTGSIDLKIFYNDLEDAIYNQTKQRIDLSTGSCQATRAYLNQYFDQHLALKINGNNIPLKIEGCEINDQSIWLHYQFDKIAGSKTVDVKADYLMELFPTQTNIVSINNYGDKKMFKLELNEPFKQIKF